MQRQSSPEPQPVQIERRAWVRYATHVDISCRPTGAMRDAGWPGRIWNVSQGGMALLLRHRFRLGTYLLVEAKGKPEQARQAHRVRVVHSQAVRVDGHECWLIGCVFVQELSTEEFQALLQ